MDERRHGRRTDGVFDDFFFSWIDGTHHRPGRAVSGSRAKGVLFGGGCAGDAARPLAYGFFHVMNLTGEQVGSARTYFDILVYGSVIPLMRSCLSSFFPGVGRTRVVMAASLSAMTVNVLASYILIFGKLGFPALGIKGAAVGSVFGSACGVMMRGCLLFSARLLERIQHQRFVRA